MKPIAQTIAFTEPLRDIRLGAGNFVSTAAADLLLREQRSFDSGVREGERRLSQQLLQQRHELLQVQNGVLKSLTDSVDTVIEQCEGGLIELALSAAYKLVGELPISAEMVRQNISEAIAMAKDNAELVVRLHPEDIELLEKDESIVPVKGAPSRSISFQPSLDVSRGGCVVETRLGVIDARRETRMELIRQAAG